MLANLQLRKKLDQIVSDENSENWWRPDLFKEHVAPHLPEEIRVLALPPEKDANYNCFMYAFGLANEQKLLGLAGWEYTRNLHFFVDQLIKESTLEQTDVPTIGDLVVYRTKDGDISHVGIYHSNDQVVSKWSWGPLLKHKIHDVPAHYGDEVKFYNGIEKGRKAILKNFAESREL